MGATAIGLRRAPAGRRPVHLRRVVIRRIGAGLLRMGIRLRPQTPSLSPTWDSHSLGVSYRMSYETGTPNVIEPGTTLACSLCRFFDGQATDAFNKCRVIDPDRGG
jgi:hypothetical protein